MPTLTKRQKEIYDYVVKYIEKKGYSPTFEEIKKHFNLSALSTVHQHIGTLADKGYLQKSDYSARGIELRNIEEMVSIPLMGIIAAGQPIEALVEKEMIALPKNRLRANGNFFALRVAGDSMIEEKINDGDIVIVKSQSSARNGEKVVALIDNDQVTLKKIYRERSQIRLQPANSTIDPIFVDPENLIIQGIVTDVIHTKNTTELDVEKNIEVEPKQQIKGDTFKFENILIAQGDALNLYKTWGEPTVIMADGPYGINGYPGDLGDYHGLAEWYEPHIKKWTELSSLQTTLWFWNTEIGWASVHPVLEKYGWEYKGCHVWNKGLGHIAGNVNTKSIRKFPVTTEVCVQYQKKPIVNIGIKKFLLKEWLRYEWKRTGLPLSKTNEICEVEDAATRKYFTLSDLWYFPPAEKMEKLIDYANKHGQKENRPFFSLDQKKPLTAQEWDKLRPKFKCPHGFTNVWDVPAVNGIERLRNGNKALHLNQKPLKLMRLLIEASSEEKDTIWEPFGGLFSGTIAANELQRRAYGAEIDKTVFKDASSRIKQHFNNRTLDLD